VCVTARNVSLRRADVEHDKDLAAVTQRTWTNLKDRRPSLLTRHLLWLSVTRQIDGLWIGCYDKENAEASLNRVEDALRLIKAYDPRRYRRLLRDLERIWVAVIVGGIAHFDASIWTCVLDPRIVLNDAKTSEDIATAIVHEATHARLWRRGFRYSEEVRSRVEAICFRRERAFAAKLPNGEQIRDSANRCLTAYAGREHWTDEAFYRRYEEGVSKALEHIGVPKWLMPALRASRRLHLRLARRQKNRQA
jgi:hypothetical protein